LNVAVTQFEGSKKGASLHLGERNDGPVVLTVREHGRGIIENSRQGSLQVCEHGSIHRKETDLSFHHVGEFSDVSRPRVPVQRRLDGS
jgi:hypothetical protein